MILHSNQIEILIGIYYEYFSDYFYDYFNAAYMGRFDCGSSTSKKAS